jgi:MYXO-CTERM domain-containing protein
MNNRLAALVAAGLALVGGPAFAAASASAALSGLTVTLVDLYPSDGGQPGVRFQTLYGGAEVGTYSYDSSLADPSSDAAFSSYPLSGAAKVLSDAGRASALAAMGGDPFAGTGLAALVAAAPSASVNGYSTAIAQYGLGSGGATTLFSLAPGTRIDISGTVTLSASSDTAGMEYADAGLQLKLFGFADPSQNASVTFTVDASSGSGTQSLTEHFDISFDGQRDAVTDGYFYGSLLAEASTSDPPPAVPEPAGALPWLAGLGALAAWRRRRP